MAKAAPGRAAAGRAQDLTYVFAESLPLFADIFPRPTRDTFVTIPNDLLEAARIDGSSELSTFIRIMLPLARPIIMTLAIFSFQWRWNDYLWPLIILNDPHQFTLQIGVAGIVGAENVNWSVLLGASVMSMVPLVALYLVFQKYVMNADINAGLKD